MRAGRSRSEGVLGYSDKVRLHAFNNAGALGRVRNNSCNWLTYNLVWIVTKRRAALAFPDVTMSSRVLLTMASFEETTKRRLMLELLGFEAQLLFYPPNGFYRRHLDSLRGTRVVSVVTYLNKGWSSADGGALAVWAAGAEDEAAPLVGKEAGIFWHR